MATGFTAGTPLGSQYQYTPITFAPLLSLVPQRPAAAPEAPAPTGLEATAQMPVPQYMGEAQGPGGEMQPFSGPMVGEKSFGKVMSEIGSGLSMVTNPLPTLISLVTTGKTLMENMGLMFGQQQQQAQAPVETILVSLPSEAALTLAEQTGMSPAFAQGLINAMGGENAVAGQDIGNVAAQALGFDTGMGTSYGAIDNTGPGVGDIGDVGGIGGNTADSSDISGSGLGW